MYCQFVCILVKPLFIKNSNFRGMECLTDLSNLLENLSYSIMYIQLFIEKYLCMIINTTMLKIDMKGNKKKALRSQRSKGLQIPCNSTIIRIIKPVVYELQLPIFDLLEDLRHHLVTHGCIWVHGNHLFSSKLASESCCRFEIGKRLVIFTFKNTTKVNEI